VTGILRRDDAEEAIRRYPIGIIPLGDENNFARGLLNYKGDPKEPKFIAEAAMTVVKHKMTPSDLAEVTIVENDSSASDPVILYIIDLINCFATF